MCKWRRVFSQFAYDCPGTECVMRHELIISILNFISLKKDNINTFDLQIFSGIKTVATSMIFVEIQTTD